MKISYDEEVADILQNVPSKYVTKILILVLAIMLALILFSIIIKKPDVIPSRVKIISNPTPVTLRVKNEGYLHMQITNKDSVVKGTSLAYIGNEKVAKEILHLDQLINRTDFLPKELDSIQLKYLGDISPFFIEYTSNLEKLNEFKRLNEYDLEISFQNSILRELRHEDSLYNDIYQSLIETNVIYKKQLKIDSALFENKHINLDAYTRSKLEFKKDYFNIQSHRVKINSIKKEIVKSQENKKLLCKKKNKKQKEIELHLKVSFNILIKEIEAWKKNNVLRSPIKGIAEIATLTRDRNYVFKGQKILSIIPYDHDVFAQVIIPSVGYGKVKIGQRVDIKLFDYPHYEFGTLNGILEDVSYISQDSVYITHINVNKKLLTTRGKQLRFIHNMAGSADIITEEMSIFEMIFNRIRSLFH